MANEANPIAAVLVHVPDWEAGFEWYRRAFPEAAVVEHPTLKWRSLRVGTVQLELVDEDEKVASGPCGAVVYWWTERFDERLEALVRLGATLHRGPMEIERGWKMGQVKDPYGNLIGLRGP